MATSSTMVSLGFKRSLLAMLKSYLSRVRDKKFVAGLPNLTSLPISANCGLKARDVNEPYDDVIYFDSMGRWCCSTDGAFESLSCDMDAVLILFSVYNILLLSVVCMRCKISVPAV